MTMLSGCVTRVLNDSELPIAVYDKDGKLVEGYRGYSDGVIARLAKDCQHTLDATHP